MINANKAQELAKNYVKAIEKEKREAAIAACEELSVLIEDRAKRGITSLTIDRHPNSFPEYVVEELISNGYKADYSYNTCQIYIQW